jgi:hypothetical protein
VNYSDENCVHMLAIDFVNICAIRFTKTSRHKMLLNAVS